MPRAKRKQQQPLFILREGVGAPYDLHIHSTEIRRQKHWNATNRTTNSVYLASAKLHAMRGEVRDVLVYGSFVGENGKVYEDPKPTKFKYDPVSGEYGWDVLLAEVRNFLSGTRVREFEETEVEQEAGPRKTELEW